LGEIVETVVKILTVMNILLKTEDSPLSEVDWLVHDGPQNLGVVQWSGSKLAGWLSLFVESVGWLEDLWSLEYLGFDCIWLKVDVEVPLFDFLGVGNHSVQLLDGANSLVWLLEQGLTDVSHDLLVLSNLGWDANKGTKLRWQIDILTLLSDLEKWLIYGVYLYVVSRQEVINHVGSGLLISMVKDVVLGVHVPLDLMHLVGTVWSVLCHDNSSFEFSVDEGIVVSL